MAKKLVPDGKGGYIEKADDKEKDDKSKAGSGSEGETEKSKSKASEEEKEDAEDDDAEKAKKAKAKADGEDEEKSEAKKQSQVDLLITTAKAIAKVAETVHNGGELPESFFKDMNGNLAKITGEKPDDLLTKLDAMQKDLDDLKGKGKAKGKAKEEKEEDGDEEKSETKKLLAKIDDLEKKVSTQSDEIKKLREEPSSSNGIVEKGGSQSSSDEDSWPLDMASEDKVSKKSAEARDVSFYD